MTDTTTHTFRPSWKAYKAFLVTLPAAAIVFAVTFAFVAGRNVAFGGTLIILTGLIIAFLLIVLFMKTAKIIITSDSITYRKPLSRRTLHLGQDLEGMLVGYSDTTGGGLVGNNSRTHMLFLYNKTQGKRMKLHGGFWTVEDMQNIARLVGAQNLLDVTAIAALAEKEKWGGISIISGVTTKMLAKHRPQYLAWHERHPGIAITLGVIIGLLIIAVIVVIVMFVNNPHMIPWEVRMFFMRYL